MLGLVQNQIITAKKNVTPEARPLIVNPVAFEVVMNGACEKSTPFDTVAR